MTVQFKQMLFLSQKPHYRKLFYMKIINNHKELSAQMFLGKVPFLLS